MFGLAYLYREQAKYPEAEALFGQILQISRRVFGLEDAKTLDCMDRLAEVLLSLAGWSAGRLGG